MIIFTLDTLQSYERREPDKIRLECVQSRLERLAGGRPLGKLPVLMPVGLRSVVSPGRLAATSADRRYEKRTERRGDTNLGSQIDNGGFGLEVCRSAASHARVPLTRSSLSTSVDRATAVRRGL